MSAPSAAFSAFAFMRLDARLPVLVVDFFGSLRLLFLDPRPDAPPRVV